jgi:hypothetical protein
MIKYLEAGAAAWFERSDYGVHAAEAERTEAPGAPRCRFPILPELGVLQQTEKIDQAAEIVQNPLHVQLTSRPAQPDAQLQPHRLTVPLRTDIFG